MTLIAVRRRKNDSKGEKKSRKEARKRMAVARRIVFVALVAGLFGFFIYNNTDYFLTVGDKAAAKPARAEKPRNGKAPAELTWAEKVEARRVKAEKARDEKAAAELVRAEKAEAKRVKAEKASDDKARAELVRAEKAEARRVKAEKARDDKARKELVKAEKAGIDKARAEQVRAEKAEAKRVKAEKVRDEKAAAELVRAEKAGIDKARAELAGAEKAEAKRVKAEKTRDEKAAAELVRAEKKAEAKRIKAEKAGIDKAGAGQVRAEKAEAKRVKAEKARDSKARAELVKAGKGAKRAVDGGAARKLPGLPGLEDSAGPAGSRSVNDILGAPEFFEPIPKALLEKVIDAGDGDVIEDIACAKASLIAGSGDAGRADDSVDNSAAEAVRTANLELEVDAPEPTLTLADSDSTRALRELLTLLSPRPQQPPKAQRPSLITRISGAFGMAKAPKEAPAASQALLTSVPPEERSADKAGAAPAKEPASALASEPQAERAPPPLARPEPRVFLLPDITARLADRDDLRISMSVELLFESEALREEVNFKRGALAAVASSVVRNYEFGNMALAALSADLLDSFNRLLKAGPLSGVDVRNFHVEQVAAR